MSAVMSLPRGARADLHRPSIAVAANYLVLAIGEIERFEDPETGRDVKCHHLYEESPRWSELDQPDSSTWDGHREGQCDHCGAHIKYFSVIEHKPTGDILTIGLQCTGRFLNLNWSLMKQRLEAERTRREVLARVSESDPVLADAAVWADADTSAFFRFRDDAKALFKGYTLTEWQVSRLVKAHAEYVAKQARQASGQVNTVPSGKVSISGTVQSVKSEPNPYASRSRWATEDEKTIRKVLVLDDRGFKVFGTLPKAASGAKKGDRISFDATCEASKRDAEFGTFSRPLNCKLLEDPKTESGISGDVEGGE